MTASSARPLEPAVYRELVRAALVEDLGGGDRTTDLIVSAHAAARGRLVAKVACVVAGLAVAAEVFRQLDDEVTFVAAVADGQRVEPNTDLAVATGRARALLTGERTALNFLQRLSGIATLTRRFVDASGALRVLDTRKTTPLMRALEKYAVGVGGGTNHRMGLDDGILIKDNHIRLAGSIETAVARVRAVEPTVAIEVEAQSLEEVHAALALGVTTVMVDNLPVAQIREAVLAASGRARIEISGGVTLSRLAELAVTGADDVSVGALTHSAPAADISFELGPI